MGQIARGLALAISLAASALSTSCTRFGFGLPGTTGSGDATSGDSNISPGDAAGPTDLTAPGWARLPAGSVRLGSPIDEACRSNDETQLSTQLSAFEMQRTEVTQTQFQRLMGYNPANNAGCGDCPIERVTWHEAAAYCDALSVASNLTRCYSCSGSRIATRCSPIPNFRDCSGYRLPSEAEWEYAARAGTTTALYNGELATCQGSDAGAQAIGWHHPQANQHTHPVAQKLPNGWGLYDTSGNVWEWVHDWYSADRSVALAVDPFGPNSGSERVIRGGCFTNAPHNLRSANREHGTPDERSEYFGLRCVRRLR